MRRRDLRPLPRALPLTAPRRATLSEFLPRFRVMVTIGLERGRRALLPRAARAPSCLAVLEEFHLAEPPLRFLESPVRTAEIPSLARQHLIAFLHFHDHERLLMDRNQRTCNADREDVRWITRLCHQSHFTDPRGAINSLLNME